MQEEQRTFVRKFGQNDRNLERLTALNSIGLPVPQIQSKSADYYDMEYIHHTNMVNWLLHNHIDGFVAWISFVIDILKTNSVEKNYLEVYKTKLNSESLQPWFEHLPFTAEELIQKLPITLPASQYHGDFTMDNCLYGIDGKFYLIDPLTTEYDSWVFDLCKIMQDLECGWFIRNSDIIIYSKLLAIRSALLKRYPIANNSALLILMLLRVLPYAKNDQDKKFLIREINRLWM